MGMYTEIRTNLTLNKNTPATVIALIQGMIDDTDKNEIDAELTNREHPFFACDRWSYIFRMGSAYFEARPEAFLSPQVDGTYKLTSVANLKNYDKEIAKFADYIRPFCMPQTDPIVTSEYEEFEGILTRYYQDGRIETDEHPIEES